MKLFISSILILLAFNLFAATHQCQVYSVIQRYDATTMRFKSADEATSVWFDVSGEAHEDEKLLDLKDKSGLVGSAKVWTGTLLSTPEGDLLQAHANFTIMNVSGSASLIMSLDSSLAKSSVVMDTASDTEFILVPVDLKCIKK